MRSLRPLRSFIEFGERTRGVKFFCLCTPVVCTGGPPILLANPPNKSVKPPKADKLVNAFSAPGLVNSWANGIADAKELLELDDAINDVVLFDCVLLPPADGDDDDWLFDSWRLAFWSSTLWGIRI